MKRACGTVFLLSALFFFPFPNPVVAPGYGHLAQLRVPAVREVISEFPEPWNQRTLSVIDESRWFYFESIEAMQFFSGCFRHFLASLVVQILG